ncbi:MAG: MFS transporter, partial [Actinomycetota bacterium]|nr:MFS transporter [Actinomycetota bacterium]
MALRHAFVDLGPLRTVPVYRRLWFGQTASGLGSQMTLVAVLFQVWELTESAIWTGAVGMAQAVPLIVFGLFAGSLVDRHDRRRLYLLAMSGQAVCSVLLALQAFFLHLPVLALLGLVAAQACFSAAGAPAARTFLPLLLTREQLAAGLALTRIGFQSAMLAGPAVGGVVLGVWGVGACYAVDAVTFCLALWGAFGLPAATPSGGRPGLRGVLDGLSFLV